VHAELAAKGLHVSEKRVARLMRADGLFVRQKRRFRRTTNSNHTDPIAPNVPQRDFEPELLEPVLGDRRDLLAHR